MVVRGQEPTAVLSFCATARALPGVQAIARDDCKRRSLERAVGQRPTRERAVAPSWWPSERTLSSGSRGSKRPPVHGMGAGGAAPKRLPNTIPAPLACVLGASAFAVCIPDATAKSCSCSVMMARAADAARGVNDQISGLARQDRATQQRLSIPRVANGSRAAKAAPLVAPSARSVDGPRGAAPRTKDHTSHDRMCRARLARHEGIQWRGGRAPAAPPLHAAPAPARRRGRRAQRGSRALRLLRGAADGIPARQHAFPAVVVELYRESGRVFVDGCGFSEIEDAVEAVQELVEEAKRRHDGS